MARWRSAHVSTSTDRIGCELEPTAVERLSPSQQPNAMRTAGEHARARYFRGTRARARACRTVQVDADVEVDDVAVGEGPTVGDAATDGWMDGTATLPVLPVLAALWLAATQRASDEDLQGTPGTTGY
jgi:hypothetical protein